MTTLKDAARARVEAERDALLDLSHRIHAQPELGYEEERAAAWLCEALEAGGLAVERGVAGLPTAFAARAGSGAAPRDDLRRVRRAARRSATRAATT